MKLELLLLFLTSILAANRRVSWADGFNGDEVEVVEEEEVDVPSPRALGQGVQRIQGARRHPRNNVFVVRSDAEELANEHSSDELYVDDAEEEPLARNNGPKLVAGTARLAIDRPINGGWFRFRFGAVGTEANRYFRFHSTGWTRLELVDLYCNGDRFTIVNRLDGEGGEEDQVIGESSPVTADGCQAYEMDPQAAMGDGHWSRAVSYLAPGRYNLHVRVRQSPYEGGSAAIRFTAVDAADVPRADTRPTVDSARPQTEGRKPPSATGAGVSAGATRFLSMRHLNRNSSSSSSRRQKPSRLGAGGGRRGVVSASGVLIHDSDVQGSTRPVRGSAHVTVHRPSHSSARFAGIGTRRSTRFPPHGGSSNLQARAVCAGWEDYVVLIGLYRGEDVEAVCEEHDMEVAMIPQEGAGRQGAARSISYCLGDLQQAWIYEYEGYEGTGMTLSLQAKKDRCRVIEQRPERLLPVLCRVPQFER